MEQLLKYNTNINTGNTTGIYDRVSFISSKLLFAFFILVFGGGFAYSQNYINYIAINQRIKQSMEEHQRQTAITEMSAQNTALETANKDQNSRVEEVYKDIRGRLNKVQPFVQAIPTAVDIYNSVNHIISNQEKLIALLRESPIGVVEVYQPYITFAEDAYDVLGLTAGIIVSYGTISQMEQADRMKLLNYCRAEFVRLETQSRNMVRKVYWFLRSIQRQRRALEHWVNKDKQLVEDVIRNYGELANVFG